LLPSTFALLRNGFFCQGRKSTFPDRAGRGGILLPGEIARIFKINGRVHVVDDDFFSNERTMGEKFKMPG
jgi:hypothetical protein